MNPPELTIVQRAVLQRLPALGLPSGARVLDAPCGGTAALTLALLERGFDTVGADVDPEAEARLGKVFARANLDAPFPWPDRSFDVAFSTEGIEHLENHFSFLREMSRILKPGGVLVFCTCSLEPEEGPAIIDDLVRSDSRVRRRAISPTEFAGLEAFVTDKGDLRTLPCHLCDPNPQMSGLDGFYAARLDRI